MVKGSWFSDVRTASGRSAATTPGISIPIGAGGHMGDTYEVTTPEGKKVQLPLIDRGPAAWTHRGLDVSRAALPQMGYTEKNFPTDAYFGLRRMDDADRSAMDRGSLDRSVINQHHTVHGTGKISVDVRAPEGTKVGAQGGGIFKSTEVSRQTQMHPADKGPATFAERFAGGH
jgi:hypothetical protein